MIALQLNHNHTPTALAHLNEKLEALLADSEVEDEVRFERMLQLVRQRDSLISQHLSSLDESSRRQFAQNELSVNNQLNELAQSLLNSAKNDISHFIKSQSAIKKYK
ncbi:hypothetical protein IT774_12465 [Salinimonas marina]|uniref:Uncharacterized protein n=1 Tax=Salinimonas marina TaxID=2785918 RepID=A0A7S9DVY6_9ALTE|nr:hypothetical protein [Salinimonas marina]QPG04962.1 hypothetical protein IT774_12465 [Salinimonas marina]